MSVPCTRLCAVVGDPDGKVAGAVQECPAPPVVLTARVGRLIVIRSNHACLFRDHAVFADWRHAAVGDSEQKLTSVLSTLHLEGGPPPFETIPDSGG